MRNKGKKMGARLVSAQRNFTSNWPRNRRTHTRQEGERVEREDEWVNERQHHECDPLQCHLLGEFLLWILLWEQRLQWTEKKWRRGKWSELRMSFVDFITVFELASHSKTFHAQKKKPHRLNPPESIQYFSFGRLKHSARTGEKKICAGRENEVVARVLNKKNGLSKETLTANEKKTNCFWTCIDTGKG